MKNNALSIANYFIQIVNDEGGDIRPLKLMKLVYIAHGYMLATLNKSALNPRFDKVEAWKFGPVIPSVYHSFKSFGNERITKFSTVFTEENLVDDSPKIETPTLSGEDEQYVCKFVWKNYGNFSGSDLVTMLHQDGTPWSIVYEEGKNIEIPDELTKSYYKILVDELLKKDE